jgi:hypothetical protein
MLQAGRSPVRFPTRQLDFLNWLNPFTSTMALGSTQPLTEMSTRNLPVDKGRPARTADVTAICEPIVYKMWEPRCLTTVWASTACYRDGSTFLFFLTLCSSLAPTSSTFSSGNTRHLRVCFWSIKSPVVLSLFTKLWIVCLLGTLSSRYLRGNFRRHFLADPYFT